MINDRIKLLFVEDTGSQRNIFETSIELFNRKRKDFIIEYTMKQDFNSGMKAVSTDDYDTAIIDLRLSSESEIPEGNEIIKEIKKNQKYPIIVLSGYPEDLEEELEDEESAFFKVYHRDQKLFDDVLEEIVALYKTGITRIMSRKGLIAQIEDHLVKIFWKHISHSFEDIEASPLDTKNVILRYTITHLIEYLSSPDLNLSERYYPGEIYIIPPHEPELFTGSLLKKNNSEDISIIMAPACDMVARKNSARKAVKIMTVQIENMNMSHIKAIIKKIHNDDLEQDEKEKAEEKLNRLLSNSYSLYYHFLPPAEKFNGGFINFQKTNSLSDKEIKKSYKVIGKVTAPFLKDIISRFASYYARQGQPEIELEEIKKRILGNEK